MRSHYLLLALLSLLMAAWAVLNFAVAIGCEVNGGTAVQSAFGHALCIEHKK